MQVSELYALTDWVEKNIKESEILASYMELHNILQANAQQGQQRPFADEQEQLIVALKKVPLSLLTKSQCKFLSMIGIGEHVGGASVEELKNILYRNSLDVATAVAKIHEKIQDIEQGIQQSDYIRAGLGEYDLPEEDIGDDEILIRVIFSRDASISNVVNLKKWSARWHDIARGLAMIHGASPESIKVVGAGKGSIVLDIVVTSMIAGTVMAVVQGVAAVVLHIAKIKNLAEQTRGLKLQNDKIAKAVDAECEKAKDDAVSEITSLIKKGRKTDGEKDNALNKSVKHLVEFLSKGGELDIVIPEDNEATDENAESGKLTERGKLRRSLQEIRRLNADSMLLEYSPEDEGDDGDENGGEDGEGGGEQ